MDIQCECGKFRAELTVFPKNTPGRLKCYCDDCQTYLHYLNRMDLLDANGGTEVIPVYPSDIKIIQGKDQLRCTRLAPHGMFRFSTKCCNTPIANTDPGRPWVGTHRRMHTAKDPKQLDRIFPEIKASIMGKFAHGQLPPGVPDKMNARGIIAVLPFILKGVIFGKKSPSPFFENGQSVVEPKILSKEERTAFLATVRVRK